MHATPVSASQFEVGQMPSQFAAGHSETDPLFCALFQSSKSVPPDKWDMVRQPVSHPTPTRRVGVWDRRDGQRVLPGDADTGGPKDPAVHAASKLFRWLRVM